MPHVDPTPSAPHATPRYLTTPRWPWRLMLVAFGLTTGVLAALVASATLLPQPSPPRRAPALALPTVPTEPAPRPTPTPTTAPQASTTAPTLSSPTPDTGPPVLSGPTSTP